MSNGDGLPKGWARAKIADLVELKNGYAFKPSDWQEDGLPIVRIQNLNNPEALFNHFPGSLPDRFRIRNGDLVFAWSGTPGTSFGAHIWRGEDAWLNQHIFRVDFDSRFLEDRFLRLAINRNLDDYIFQAHGGAGLAHITKGKFESSELMIAPLPEQRRIVAKIEELFSYLDAGVAALERAKAKLKRYRAAVLKAAVEGKLTEDWRARQVNAASRRAQDRAQDRAFVHEQNQASIRAQNAALPPERGGTPRLLTQRGETPCLLTQRGETPCLLTQRGETPRLLTQRGETPRLLSEHGYFRPEETAAILSGSLPHWRQDGVTYFVTFRVGDSLPTAKLSQWLRERDAWVAVHPKPWDDATRDAYHRQFTARIEKWLDAGYGSCPLARTDVRAVVVQALRHFDGVRYWLDAWVVMPNHVHVIVTPCGGHELSEVLHSWKSFTSHALCKLLSDWQGSFWQKESFDHIVRGPDHLERFRRYIARNPRGLATESYAVSAAAENVDAASRRAPVERTGTRRDAAST